MDIKYLLAVICCFLPAVADPWKRFIHKDGVFVSEKEHICPEGEGILAYQAHLESHTKCPKGDLGKLTSTSPGLKRIRDSCNGKRQCNITGTFPYVCDDNPIFAELLFIETGCKPVVPDDNKVFDISKDYVKQHITINYDELYLVINRPEGSGHIQRTCTIRGDNIKFDLKLLHADLGSGSCGSLTVISSKNGPSTTSRHLTCNNSSSLTDSDDFVDDVQDEITIQVSMASGFLWMEVEATQSFQLNCSALESSFTILATTAVTPFSSSSSSLSFTTYNTARTLKEKGDDDDDDDEDDDDLMIIVIVVVSLVVVAAIVIILVCLAFVCNCDTPLRRWVKRRKLQKKQQQQQGEQQQLQQQATYEYISEDDLNSNARSPQMLIPPSLTGNQSKNKPNRRDTSDEEYTEVSIDTRRKYKNSGADKPVMPVKPTVYSEPHSHTSNINMAVVATTKDGDLTEVTYDVADPQKVAVRPVPNGSSGYSVTSLPESAHRSGGATYDTMASITGEYARLNRPGEGPTVIDNVYDG